jgi:tetratricopeptide (TPR) repeat protein
LQTFYDFRAEIYRLQNNVEEAIMNYRQAIILNPRDHEAYFRRAEMYEKVIYK